ncbi:hypothetical protein [Pseudomonas monteilii]|uniref:hypothetical protein n=1 Tax=Pseudomonas monteilii TaxID=76759 RepID=UPI00383A9EAA
MIDTLKRTYTVLIGTKIGQLIELGIPVDAIQSPRESQAAFHRRLATAGRIRKPGTHIPGSCRCP